MIVSQRRTNEGNLTYQSGPIIPHPKVGYEDGDGIYYDYNMVFTEPHQQFFIGRANLPRTKYLDGFKIEAMISPYPRTRQKIRIIPDGSFMIIAHITWIILYVSQDIIALVYIQ